MSLKEDKEINEILDESLPEAKSSVTYRVLSPMGYPILFTLRSGDSGQLLNEMGDLENYFKKTGYQADRFGNASVPSVSNVSSVETKTDVCPKCGAPLNKFTTKDGKSGMRCSTNKWDFVAKKATGCDYVKWDDAPLTGEEATPAQESLLKAKNLWEEGMSKSEASKKISSVLGK